MAFYFDFIETDKEKIDRLRATNQRLGKKIEELDLENKRLKELLDLSSVSYCTTCKENRLQEFNKEMEELRQKYKDVLD